MALFVVLKSARPDGNNNELELHAPFSNNPKLVNEEILLIQADCDELEVIHETFGESIPTAWQGQRGNKSLKQVQCWYGDIAKTIYYNLR